MVVLQWENHSIIVDYMLLNLTGGDDKSNSVVKMFVFWQTCSSVIHCSATHSMQHPFGSHTVQGLTECIGMVNGIKVHSYLQ